MSGRSWQCCGWCVWLWVLLAPATMALADDCGRYLQNPANLVTMPQTVVEDCMRTGYAQAIITAITALIAAGLISKAAGQALIDATKEEAEKQEQEAKQKEEEKNRKSTNFRVRVHRGFDVGTAVGGGFLTVIMEEWDGSGWSNRTYLTYRGLAFPYVGVSIAGKSGGATSSSVGWNEFSTAVPMKAGDFVGAGSVTFWPGIALGTFSPNAGITLNFATFSGQKVRVHVESDGAGLGATLVSHFWMGGWSASK